MDGTKMSQRSVHASWCHFALVGPPSSHYRPGVTGYNGFIRKLAFMDLYKPVIIVEFS